jgi:selenocysteine-specific elongation factor
MNPIVAIWGEPTQGRPAAFRSLNGKASDSENLLDLEFGVYERATIGEVTLIELPLHDRYLSNLVGGLLVCDVVFIVTQGEPFSFRKRLRIAQAAGIKHMVVITEAISELIEPVLNEFEFESKHVIEPSSLTKSFEPLIKQFQSISGGPFRVYVHSAEHEKSVGVVLRGIVRGTGFNPSAEYYADKQPLKFAGKPEIGYRETVVTGVQDYELIRGQIVSAFGSVRKASTIAADVTWLSSPTMHSEVRVSVGLSEVNARLLLDAKLPNRVELKLRRTTDCILGERIVIRGNDQTLIGAGVICSVQQDQRAASATTQDVILVNVPEAIIAAIGESPEGVDTNEICDLIGQSQQQLGDHFEQLIRERKIVGFAGLWFQPQIFLAQAGKFLLALQELHIEQPTVEMHHRDQVVLRMGRKWSGKPLERIISKLEELGKVVVDGTNLRISEFRITLNEKQELFLARVEEVLKKFPINVPYPSDIARELGAPVQAVEEILRLGSISGRLIEPSNGLYYTQAQIDRFKRMLKIWASDQEFSTVAAKEHFDTSRKYISPLLEYLDRIGFTERTENGRRVVGG